MQASNLNALTMDHLQHLEKLAVGIAHEIRNPLTVVKGFILVDSIKGKGTTFTISFPLKLMVNKL
ncbi:hypothetical protein COJ85_18940 [Bacillus sp. AFS076308]|uniref:hypothetical protein n=1 Tax=Bacillus sp. AFS076308 TaxID=2033512 RepID=UPI000BFA0B13|nr:hypothetical protein [Bacillus sp. AFS076308]PFN99599.1 hypothetical protein COJ85_18940 [Bacillus sp. AFS076308]